MADNSIDDGVVRELDIYWQNDFPLYEDFQRNFVTYLNNKYIRKEYDKQKAVKLILYFVERIRAKYKKENGLGTINNATKTKLAEEIRDYYEAEYQPKFSEDEKTEAVKQAKEIRKENKSVGLNEASQKAIENVRATGV
jgi:hypothetical protein